ncbi:MAG TPA: proline dehydrogenase family protein [Chthoniobacterales bacterium]
MNGDSLQPYIAKIGAGLFAAMDEIGTTNPFSRKWVYKRLMDWSMRDERFKTELFRFVDVLPTLRDSKSVLGHLREYLVQPGLPFQKLTSLGLKVGDLAPALPAWIVRKNVEGMSDLFIIGRDGKAALPGLRQLWKEDTRFTLDVLGEAVVSDREADEYAARYHELLESLSAETKSWTPHGNLAASEPPLVNLSVKISALCARVQAAAPEAAIATILTRLLPICEKARDLGAFINLDMESYALKDLTLNLFRELLEHPSLAAVYDRREQADNHPASFSGHRPPLQTQLGCVIQAYLTDSERDLVELLDWAEAKGKRITVRLVKGAYWDYERIVAAQKNWPVPVYENKSATDANYERLSRILLDRRAVVYPAFAGHNIRSISHAIAYAEKLGVDPDEYEFQGLYGMFGQTRTALVQRGHRVREYCPVGEILPGMGYLVRRLLENTSNEGFLRAASSRDADRGALLAAPEVPLYEEEDKEEETPATAPATPAFQNHPPADFTQESVRAAFREALQSVRATLGESFLPVIDGIDKPTVDSFPSLNPGKPTEVIGSIGAASGEQADLAIAGARKSLPAWSLCPVEERADWLRHVADLMTERRFEFAALEVLEVGKTWAEADADVCEAIDFCRYYAHEAPSTVLPRLTQDVPGEVSREEHLPRGVGVIVAPWNFPLAILCGMTVAALVTGNTVVIKPAEQSSVIAARFHQILLTAGLPPGAAAFLPGRGAVVGAYLTSHPQVDFIAFTGSKEVGLQIWESAGRTPIGQTHLKKAVVEMGGKNAVIVDSDADLDEAVVGILHSAFGFQGQKCSALSRLIVLNPIHDTLLTRLIEAAAALKSGPSESPETDLGPVVDSDAFAKISRMIDQGKTEAHLAFGGTVTADPENDGYFISPTIFTDVPSTATIFREEIFGPVLAITRARDLDHAISLANDTDFALTGGVFSRSPATIDRVKRELRCGNLYINRSITGAIVERHPFGGFGLSGGGTKAGGRDYLRNFVLARVVTENTMRRGFAPENVSFVPPAQI